MQKRVVIVGSGFGRYCLLPAFQRVKGCEVVGTCGEDWKEMLQEKKPDAVAIASIPKYQYEIAKYALENGIAVFAEKPLTISVDTAKELTELAERKDLPNIVDFIFPEIPEWIEAEHMIAKGAIGNVLHMKVRWNFLSYDLKNNITSWKTNRAEGGGALSFFFSHVFYYLEHFMGTIKKIECITSSSEKSKNKGETMVDLEILFKNGSKGSALLNIDHVGQQEHTIEFHGEHGSIVLQNTTQHVVDDFELTLENKEGVQKITPHTSFAITLDSSEDPRIKPVYAIAERFIHWCNTGEAAKPDFQDGLRVQTLIETTRASCKKI